METTDKDVYLERDKVLALNTVDEVNCVHYDTISVGDFYMVRLRTGRYTLYRKTNLFDDDPIRTIDEYKEGESLLREMVNQERQLR